MKIPFSTAHLFFDMLQYCYYRGELPSVGILGSEVVLSFTLSLTGEMRVTLLKAERSLPSIKIKTPDISTNVNE